MLAAVRWGIPLVLVLISSMASAQEVRGGAVAPREAIARRELIAQAQAARAAEDHEGALALAERAAALSMTPSLRLFIAQEQAQLGHIVAAYASASTCQARAEADTTLVNRAQILRSCTDLARELRGQLALIVLRVPGDAGLHLEVAGREVPRELLGAPYAVTPGTIRIVARTPSAVFDSEVEVVAGETREVQVQLEPLAPVSVVQTEAAETSNVSEELSAPSPPAFVDEPPRADSGGLSPAIAWIGVAFTGALGVTTIALGSLTLGARDRYAAAAGQCSEAVMTGASRTPCDDARTARAEGSDLQLATNTFLIATAVIGVATLLTLPFLDYGSSDTSVSVGADPTGAAISLRTSF